MDTSWVKLYRKIATHDILFDDKALRVFIWLLTTVDKKSGKTTIGRFAAARELRMKPSTFWDALKRLEKKYKIATCESDKQKTTVCLLNWAKYQPPLKTPIGKTDNEPTADRQQSDTKQEVKNKELKTNDKSFHNGSFGNEDINFLISYLKEQLNLPLLDESEKVNRQYAHLAMRKFGGCEKVKLLIDATAHNSFWSTRITSFKQLYYKGVQIISSARGEVKAIDASQIVSGQNRQEGVLDLSGGVPVAQKSLA